MQVKLVNAKQETVLLPVGMAVQGYPVQIEVPGLEIEGRHGRVLARDMKRVKSRAVTISGKIEAVDKDDADRQRNDLIGFAFGADPICIYRHEAADTYVVGTLTGADHSYHVGYFGGRVFTLALQFEVSDPFHYSAVLAQTISPTGIANNGVQVEPVVWLVGPATNPMLKNVTTGQVVQFTGNLTAGSIVGVDCAEFQAHFASAEEMANYGTVPESCFTGASVLSQMNDEWLINGFSLVPGDNALAASGVTEWRLTFRERWL